MLKGFRDFILRGNVVTLLSRSSSVQHSGRSLPPWFTDVINPLIAAIVHKPDFSSLVLDVNGGKPQYGLFLNALISFLLISATVYFLVVLPLNKLLVVCLTQIVFY